ncbi:MAG: glycosyltransferase family 2 protein [Chitinophagaceae bacterium]|nr:MAG: glycosyltransferase family 2 protein [Chitinophagaceae bacterium]
MLSTKDSRVSVVIVTYNGAKWISPCLASVFVSDYPAQVIVVDNASADGTSKLIQSKFPETILLESKENLGFGQANNWGISFALNSGAEFIFLLNQDTTIEPDAIRKLVSGFARHPSFDLLSPAHYNGSGTAFDYGFLQYAQQDYQQKEIDKWHSAESTNVYKTGFINAAAWLVKSSVFEKIGGFSPLFFHYGEDREFFKRMEFKDLHSGIIPSARIRHYRDNRNNKKKTWKFKKLAKYYVVGFIYRLSDVNHSLPNRFIAAVYWLLKDCISLFCKGVLFAPVMFFQVLVKAIASLKKIKYHRKQVKGSEPYLFLTRFMNQNIT